MTTRTFSLFFSGLCLACIASCICLGALAVVRRLRPGAHGVHRVADDIAGAGLWISAGIAVVAMLGSLYYSEIARFTPCRLCWYQRICMYPLALVLSIAAARRDTRIAVYAIPLAAVGAAIAAYHVWIQWFPPEGPTSFCTLDAPCTERYVWEFGFVSLPFMALSAFCGIIAFLLATRWRPTTLAEAL